MKKLKSIVFFGSHELAVPALDTLEGLEVPPKLIVTRPKAGVTIDSDEPLPHPVCDWADEHGIETVRSRRVLEPDLQEKIKGLNPDLLVVVDYGRPLPAEVLEASPLGAVEVHPSLLPKLRGEHALRYALATQQKKTGVSVISLNEEPWAGGVLMQEELELTGTETFDDLLPPAIKLSNKLLTKILKKLDTSKNKPKAKAQDEKHASVIPDLGLQHRKAPWSLEATLVSARLRAYPKLGLIAYCKYRPVEIIAARPMDWIDAPYGSSGTYLGLRQGKLAMLCGNSTILGVERLRRPGGEVQSASTFAHVEQLQVGDILA
ncbi:MAG: formyltransferase family protein [Acidobacteriota bacterium]